MPDALSKTIPIWCSVINRFFFPSRPESHKLYTPPQVVSDTEHAQISALLPSFLASLEALNIPKDNFKSSISKPLRPIWVTPDSSLSETETVFGSSHPLILCTVSRRIEGGELSGGDYIQGAGDDTENWAHRLTPSVFWSNHEVLLSTPEHELPELITSLLHSSGEARGGPTDGPRQLKPTSCIFISPLSAVEGSKVDDDTCLITLLPRVTEESVWKTSGTRMDVGLGPHKVGSRNLRLTLPAIVGFADGIFYEKGHPRHPRAGWRLIIACETGKDHSIAVALVLLCLFFSDDGELLPERRDGSLVDKAFIRNRLGWISTSMPDANPSRASLQSVNSFLM